MRVDAVIQARMGSTRLPGKVLMRLGDDSVLGHVVRRLRRSRKLRSLMVVTTVDAADDAIVGACAELGVPVLRGSVDDVLSRYAAAARALQGDAVLRITSDCPLIAPEIVDAMIEQAESLEAAGRPWDYLSNTLERRLPRGLDAELVRQGALLRAADEALSAHEREHVTPFLYQHPAQHALHSWRAELDASHLRWTLDTPEDFQLLTRILDALGPRAVEAPWTEILALVELHPDWSALNAEIVQKALPPAGKA